MTRLNSRVSVSWSSLDLAKAWQIPLSSISSIAEYQDYYTHFEESLISALSLGAGGRQQSSGFEVAYIEREANERAQIRRKRAVEAEIRGQLGVVIEQLQTSRQERRVAIDAQGLLTTKLQDEKAGTQELRVNAGHGATAQQQSDDLLTSRIDNR